MLRFLALVLILLAAPSAASLPAQQPVEADLLVRLGGEPGEILRDVISRRYIIIDAPAEGVELPRDSVYETSVIVVRGPAYVSSTVQGDVIVLGADLFMRPGAEIAGRAVAMGGSTHHSTMARAAGGLWSFRFLNVEIREVPAGFEVREGAPGRERPPVVTLPGAYGLRLPSYSRVDAAVVPWGPEVGLSEGRIRITPLITWRSHPGVIDPSGHVRVEPSQRLTIEFSGGRGTFTNDGWIQTDFGNTLTTLIRGRDYRNYWRADRFELAVLPRFVVGEVVLTLGGGGRSERAWSVEAGDPWSLTGRDSPDGTERPNPEITAGRINSLLGSIAAEWQGPAITMGGRALVEASLDAPGDASFVQTTVDGDVRFPTFGMQTLDFRVRAVITAGDPAPPQRYVYMGGSGTLPTFPILSLGGDHLFFLESSYNIPIEAVALGLLGSPTISLRHMLGAAGIDRIPSLEQNIGLRIALGFFRADAVLEPVDGRTHYELGLTFIR